MDVFDNIKALTQEVDNFQIESEESLEHYRLRFIGTKNVIKDLFGEIRNVPNDQKKAFGQEVNALKQKAEEKFHTAKLALEDAKLSQASVDVDLYAPYAPVDKGARHPVSIVMNKMIDIFEKIGFTVAEEREI